MANDKDFKVKNGIKSAAYHEAVGTVVSGSEAYSLAAGNYDSVSFSVSAQDTNVYGLFFKPDGTKFYIVGSISDAVHEYTLSTAWVVSTASFTQSFSVASQETIPSGLFFKPDGTKMYVLGDAVDDVNEYTLSTAWDVSTASYVQNFSVASQGANPSGLFFKTDGTKMYVMGYGTDAVYQYSLSTAWNLSTASYDSVSFSVAAQDTVPRGLFFTPDGLRFFVGGPVGNEINEYSLTSSWDLSTASYVQSLIVNDVVSDISSVFFKDDGTKMFVLGLTNDTIYQYSTVLNTATLDLSTGSVFEITPTSDIQVSLSNPAASGTVSGATLLLGNQTVSYDISSPTFNAQDLVSAESSLHSGLSISSDGTKLFLIDNTYSDMFLYNLPTPYSVASATYSGSSFSLGVGQPNGLRFKPDGTKFYVSSQLSDNIRQYSMSTAWDITTATYDSISFSTTSQTLSPQGFSLSPDGTKLYLIGSPNFYQYTLSTPWNISTATYDNVFYNWNADVSSGLFLDVWMAESGLTLLASSSNYDAIFSYNLSVAFDISTASLSGSYLSATYLAGVRGIQVENGKLFVLDRGSSNIPYIRDFTIGVNLPTITYPTNITWPGGTAPTAPAANETDVITFTTRDGGTTYNAALAIDGAA